MTALDEDIDIRDEIKNTTEAFLSASSPKYLEELKLEPYSLMRQTIGMELAGPGSSAFFDAVIKIWLCTQDEDACLDARDNRRKAQKTAFAWAESRGYSLTKRERWQPLLDLYTKLDAEIEASLEARAAPAEGNGEAPKNSIGQPA
jgi:hypothetical protein